MERTLFRFSNKISELEVKKIHRYRSATTGYGPIEWEVIRVSVTGSAIKAGTVLRTKQVYLLAKDIDSRAAHAFELDNTPGARA